MRIPSPVLLVLLTSALPAAAQATYKCTDVDGRVTYQQVACPANDIEERINATPANPGFDPEARERLLRQGAEADQRLKMRAVQDETVRLEREARDKARRGDEERMRQKQEPANQESYFAPPYMWIPPRASSGYSPPRQPGNSRPPLPMPRRS